LARALGGHGHFMLRARIAEALGARRKSPVAKNALLAALEDHESRVRTAAAAALGNWKGEQEVALALQRHMGSDPSYATQSESVRALGRVLGKSGFDVIAAALAIPSLRDAVAGAAVD